jgi:hypothetical protein
MKSLRKSFLTLLALTLFGGAGAWAQGPTTVFEVDFSSTATATTGSMLIGSTVTPSSVSINENVNVINTIMLTSPYNYTAYRYVSIKPATGSFQTGDTLLIAVCYNSFYTKTAQVDIYAANGTTKLFTTAPGINGRNESGYPVVEKFVLEQDADSLLIGGGSLTSTSTNVTTLKVLRPAPQAIELTKSGDNQWTLGQAPDYDLELQVEYYEAHALKNIPAGWQVKVNGVDQTSAIVGDSLMIVETDIVTLIPDNPRRVKSVTLEDEAPAAVLVNIDGITLDITGCTTWADIIARNPGKIGDWDGWVSSERGVLELGGIVNTTDPYDPAQQANYHWSGI